MPNNYVYSGIKHYNPIQAFNFGLRGGTGLGRDYLNLHNGNHVMEFTDFVLPFYNNALVLKRFYNNRCDVKGMFGLGWHCNWEMKITTSGDDRKFVDSTGAEWLFVWDTDHWDRPAGLFADLTYAANVYTLTYIHDKTEAKFDDSGKLTSIENAVGVKHEVTWATGKITKIESKHTDEQDTPVRRKIEFTYSGDFVVSVKETAEDREITYEYDDDDCLVKVTLPNRDFCEFGYDGNDYINKFTDYNRNETDYEYTSEKLTKRTSACDEEHTMTYNANQTVVNDPRSKNWTHNFDGNGCRTSMVTPRNKTYSWTYNGDYLVLTYVIPGPKTAVTNTYNSDGLCTSTKDALNKQYDFTWNGSELLTTITDPDSNTITFTHNADRQVLTVTDQESECTEYAYSSLGALEKVTDPKDFETKMENNVYGQQIKITDPLGQTTEITYDDGSIVPVSAVGKDGRKTQHSYDELKRILYTELPDGGKIEYTWCGSNLAKIVKRTYEHCAPDDVLDFVSYSHDADNRVVSVDTVEGGFTKYTFNENGQIASVLGMDDQKREYTYDDDGNLTRSRVKAASDIDYDFTVDDRGWRTRIDYPNSWHATLERNDRGQITSMALFRNGTQDHLTTYAYNNLALVSQAMHIEFQTAKGAIIAFTRDDVGRVTRENRTNQGSYGTDYDLHITYDDNGNITRIDNQAAGGEDISMDYDPLNRLVRYYDSENTEKGIFSYNCKSMLKAKEVDGDITKFDYDAFNVLNQIIKPNADELDFNFDMLGRLREYETSNRESAFDMDGTKRLGDFEDKTDEWRRYHWCKQHLLGYKDDSNTYYFLTEPDGSVEVIFTHGGTTVNRLEYDFLGKLRNQTTTPQVELLWNGMFFLDETDLYIIICTIYDATLGFGQLGYNVPNPMEYDNAPPPPGSACAAAQALMNYYGGFRDQLLRIADCYANDAFCFGLDRDAILAYYDNWSQIYGLANQASAQERFWKRQYDACMGGSRNEIYHALISMHTHRY